MISSNSGGSERQQCQRCER